MSRTRVLAEIPNHRPTYEPGCMHQGDAILRWSEGHDYCPTVGTADRLLKPALLYIFQKVSTLQRKANIGEIWEMTVVALFKVNDAHGVSSSTCRNSLRRVSMNWRIQFELDFLRN